jgi:DNA-binding transcriptional regulator YiaG
MKKRDSVVIQRTKSTKSSGIMKLVPSSSGITAIKDFATRYQISHDTLTRITGFSLRAITNWAQGARPSNSSSRRFTETKRLFEALERLVSPEAIGPWLKDPNPAFDGSTPLQVIERGETDRIWRMLHELESGEPA